MVPRVDVLAMTEQLRIYIDSASASGLEEVTFS